MDVKKEGHGIVTRAQATLVTASLWASPLPTFLHIPRTQEQAEKHTVRAFHYPLGGICFFKKEEPRRRQR